MTRRFVASVTREGTALPPNQCETCSGPPTRSASSARARRAFGTSRLPCNFRLSAKLPVSALVFAGLISCTRDEPPPPPPPSNLNAAPVQPVAQPVAQPNQPAIPTAGATISLRPAFTPDPHVVSGRSGGPIQGSNLNPQCAGWISQAPNHVLQSPSPFRQLVIAVNAGSSDTTLVVQKADGGYLCNDDEDGTNPMVSGAIPEGATKIWVGSYTQNEQVPYTLGISELTTTRPSSLTPPAGAVVAPGNTQLTTDGTSSNFGTITLRSGFTPDPHVAAGNSGGTVNASNIGSGCAGWVSAQPDHLLIAESAFSNLRLLVKSDQDTTLVVRKPDGSFQCDDDTEELNPIVGGAFPAGTYRIWVGSYRQGQNSAYKLGVTELASVTAASLP